MDFVAHHYISPMEMPNAQLTQRRIQLPFFPFSNHNRHFARQAVFERKILWVEKQVTSVEINQLPDSRAPPQPHSF